MATIQVVAHTEWHALFHYYKVALIKIMYKSLSKTIAQLLAGNILIRKDDRYSSNDGAAF